MQIATAIIKDDTRANLISSTAISHVRQKHAHSHATNGYSNNSERAHTAHSSSHLTSEPTHLLSILSWCNGRNTRGARGLSVGSSGTWRRAVILARVAEGYPAPVNGNDESLRFWGVLAPSIVYALFPFRSFRSCRRAAVHPYCHVAFV